MKIIKINNSDMPEYGWWNYLPKTTLKWIRLGRFDRPIGFWLLLLPGWWILPFTKIEFKNCIWLMLIFFIGSIVMRAAGCTINDLWDQDIDKKILRTKNRPIANGEISFIGAFIFLIIMILIALICLTQLNINSWLVAIASLPLIIIYPLAKRYMKWPQVILGITFSWAVLTAWSASEAEWIWAVFIMYLATVFWIIGYDTIYGCSDRNEDEIIGIKNSAISAKTYLTTFVAIMYILTLILLVIGGFNLDANYYWYISIFIISIHFINQIKKLKQLQLYSAIDIFKSNRNVGLILTLGSLGNYLNF